MLHERQRDDDGTAAQGDKRDEIEDEEAPRGVSAPKCAHGVMRSHRRTLSVRAAEAALLEAGAVRPTCGYRSVFRIYEWSRSVSIKSC